MSKLLNFVEKIILKRIKGLHLDQRLPAELFGFRRGQSTVLLAANVIQNALNKIKMQQNTLPLALDVKKAFERVWLNGLISNLVVGHDYPLYSITLIYTYITVWALKVQVAATLSTSNRTQACVPQGAVLPPLLFNLYTHDFPR